MAITLQIADQLVRLNKKIRQRSALNRRNNFNAHNVLSPVNSMD